MNPTIDYPKSDREFILSQEAVDFLSELHLYFNARRLDLLEKRKVRQKAIDRGEMPDFFPNTAHIRNADWKAAPFPEEIADRRVEITGPVERKMIINALNSGANVFMADFEDSNSATWQNCIQGQINLFEAIRKTISFTNETGKNYSLNEKTAILFVRPRGWHLEEKHFLIDQEPVSASLFDFGLYFFHNAKELIDRGSRPYFYLPKLESHLEARLWNDVFVFSQQKLGIPQATIKATVLIETILASFEMDEIIYELKDHSAGLNCGRWDYIFSLIKKFSKYPEFVLPERSQVTMTVPFMKAYSDLVIKTCHRRGVHAMGGMAAQIPIKNDPQANQIALSKVSADKEREAKAGHDGTWVAHPGLIAIAKEQFDRYMSTANQINVLREDVNVSASDLLSLPKGTISIEGFRLNIDVSIQYIEAWLKGNGCVPIYNLMEDAATAEISRAQLWQWIKHKSKLDDGTTITAELFHRTLPVVLDQIKSLVGEQVFTQGKYDLAAELLRDLVLAEEFEEFLTLKAYSMIE
jgi:malate synthase